MSEGKESKNPDFQKLPQPDFAQFYSAERIEPIRYVTIWEGGREEHEFRFDTDTNTFKTAPEIEAIRGQLIEFQTKGKIYRDDPKTRLADGVYLKDTLILIFQKVSYSDYIITNNAMEIKPAGWSKTIRQVLEPGPELPSLRTSRCSNHLGLSCVVLAKDRKVILQQAGQQKITGAGQLTSSASGAMDWKEPFVNPFEVMQAELFEEIGLEHEETAQLVAVAIARELARGGKPEMFFVLETDLGSEEILARLRTDPEKEVEKVLAIDLPEDKNEAENELKRLWESPNTAQSTKAALYYFNRYLQKY